jgi:hypothetical protein
MKSGVAIVIFCCFFLLFINQISFCDTIVATGSASSSAEDHSSRQTVAIGDELVFEEEHFGPPVEQMITIPLTYSLPTGFQFTSAILEFAIDGAFSSYMNSDSVPLDYDFVAATMQPVLANIGPTIVVSIGNESFLLMTDVASGSVSADLFALGYGDLLQQGAPVSITGFLTLFSYVEAGQAPWWGRNAISEVSIDQYWSGDLDAKLTLETQAVPEPATLLLIGSGMLGLVRRSKRRAG